MSNKTVKRKLLPKLRFPEFREAGEWRAITLQKASVPVTERVGQRKLMPVSISAGIGFVSQAEKFGRDISGNQYQLYTLVSDGDFVYNKGNSLKFPEGCVYLLQGWGKVAAPNVFICFRLKDGYSNGFFQNCFEQNLHGKQLKKHITSGARSNGLLNISKENFFGVEIPTPSSPEQQKIADCLASLDELITQEAQQLDKLKTHKKGMMKQLFPAEGETLPKLRFHEFQDAGEWENKELSSLIQLISGLHLSPDQYSNSGTTPYFTGPSDFTNEIQNVSKWTKESTSIARENDILITVKGSGVGEIFFLALQSVAMGRQLMALRSKKGSSRFIYQFLLTKRTRFGDLASGNLIPGLSRGDILDLEAHFPSLPEQQKIADCLTSLDDLVTAQTQKLAALKTHKKGLMQQLFPVLDEVPE
jgi:type I restriction enzyme, S subunit